jgi:glutamate N-acetyltransferase/amino-acid N-acetyltransferase
MAVNLPPLPELHPVPGIRLGTTRAQIRKKDRRDLVVIECAPGTQAAAVFTQNRFCAAPVTVAREHLAQTAPRALLINTGFANAGTGPEGMDDAHRSCAALATIKVASFGGVLLQQNSPPSGGREATGPTRTSPLLAADAAPSPYPLPEGEG